MSDKRYEANIIRATAVEPANNLETTSAPGVWSIDEVVELQKKNKWPTVGNVTTDVDEVFSTFLYDGNGTAQPIENGIKLGNSNDGGSVKFGGSNSGDYITFPSSSDFAFGTGDFTIECFVNVSINNGNGFVFNISADNSYYSATAANQLNFQVYLTDFQYGNNAGFSAGPTTITYGQFVHLAMARSGTTLKFFVNGTQESSVTDSTNYTGTYLAIGIGYGSAFSLDGYISNFRVVKGTAVYTSAFTPPTSALTAITNTKLLTLQGDTPFVDNSSSARTATQLGSPAASDLGPFTGTGGEGGLVWTKDRSATYHHYLYDTVRGVTKQISSSNSNAEGADLDTITAFNSNGFTIGDDIELNTSGNDYVSWTFRKAPKFFDIVTWSGTGSSRTISHNLGSVPAMLIIKCTSHTGNWSVWHKSVTSPNSNWWRNYSILNSTMAFADWGNDTGLSSEPTSTAFSLGSGLNDINASGRTYVAYLFAHNNNDGEFGPSGDQDIIKCGSFSTDSSGDASVTLGFEPQWLMIKRYDGTSNWTLMDIMRGYNDSFWNPLYADTTNAESGFAATRGFPTSTGFEFDGQLSASANYIYMAIRRGPLAAPEDATKVFSIDTLGTSAPYFDSNHIVDMGLVKQTGAASSWFVYTRLVGEKNFYTDFTAAENNASEAGFDFMNGHIDSNWGGTNSYSWMWKRAPGYFDVVAYTGAGAAQTVNHNLGVVPEMMWIKNRGSSENWAVYHSALGTSKYLHLNTTDGALTTDAANRWNNTSPTATQFTVGTSTEVSHFTRGFIAYLFATVAGVSKVGSASHTYGTDSVIDCGFSSSARFVLMKATSRTSDWIVFDSTRGLVAGDDAYLNLNDTSAEGSADLIDPSSGGFTLPGNSWSTRDVIFYAIA